MKIVKFGANPHSWNIGTRDGDDDSGYPGICLFGNAIQVWSIAQDREVTVDDAAAAFNVDFELAWSAIDAHLRMLVGPGDVIEHDGE